MKIGTFLSDHHLLSVLPVPGMLKKVINKKNSNNNCYMWLFCFYWLTLKHISIWEAFVKNILGNKVLYYVITVLHMITRRGITQKSLILISWNMLDGIINLQLLICEAAIKDIFLTIDKDSYPAIHIELWTSSTILQNSIVQQRFSIHASHSNTHTWRSLI